MDVRVGVAGATGALGGEILRVLDKAPWRPKTVVPMASAGTTVPAVEYGDDRVTVEDLQYEEIGELDALIAALPAQVARGVVERAIADGVPAVDCARAVPGLPLVIPWVNPEVLSDPEVRAVAIPGIAPTLLASVLGPLRRAGIEGDVDGTVLLPASTEGKSGIDELSRQVIALFNSGTPPRKVFDGGLAFDLVPQLGATGERGWTDLEHAAAADIAALTGWTGDVRITLVLVPLFSGASASLSVHTARRISTEMATRILSDGGVRLGDPKSVRPRRVEGKAFVHASRLRTGAGESGLHAWLSMDNLRTGAAAAVGAAGTMLKRREAS
jgi:aspartate-semialdehyde dehydrogenase